MTDIQTVGRTDLDALFKESGCLDGTLTHHPFLAFVARGDAVAVEIVNSAERLSARYAPETPVMVQWAGRWSSEFFRMTVADVTAGLAARRAEHSCAGCGVELRGGYAYRPYWPDPDARKLCRGCGDAYDAEHPQR